MLTLNDVLDTNRVDNVNAYIVCTREFLSDCRKKSVDIFSILDVKNVVKSKQKDGPEIFKLYFYNKFLETYENFNGIPVEFTFKIEDLGNGSHVFTITDTRNSEPEEDNY